MVETHAVNAVAGGNPGREHVVDQGAGKMGGSITRCRGRRSKTNGDLTKTAGFCTKSSGVKESLKGRDTNRKYAERGLRIRQVGIGDFKNSL